MLARIETGTIPAIASDQSLFPIEKMEAHRKGILHQAISIFVFDGDSLLLQRRADDKYHCGGLWANTCCSHPHFGETLETCAKRRLQEELGFSLELQRRGTIEYCAEVGEGLKEHERVAVFQGHAGRDDLHMAPDPNEVSDTCWLALPELRRRVSDHPEEFAPWLRIYASRWGELGFV